MSGSGVADEGYVVTQFHGEAAGGLGAGVGQHSDEDDMGHAALFELEVQVRVGESALGPVFFDHHVAMTGDEVGVEFATPATFGEGVVFLDADLDGGWGVPSRRSHRAASGGAARVNTRIPVARAIAVTARRLPSSPTSVATCFNRGQTCPPSDKKSLYGSTSNRPVRLLSYGRWGMPVSLTSFG